MTYMPIVHPSIWHNSCFVFSFNKNTAYHITSSEMENSDYDQYQYYSYFNGCESGGMNISYEEAEKLLLYSEGSIFYTQCILPFLLLVGVLDNTAFIYVVVKQSFIKTATNFYLVNLAVADIVFLTIGIGEKIWKYTQSPFVNDDTSIASFGCIVIPFLTDTAYFASLFFVSLVSAEIFCAVCYPKGNSLALHRIWSRWFTLLAWSISAIVAAVLAPSNAGVGYMCFTWGDRERLENWPEKLTVCGTHLPWLTTVVHIIQTVPFFVTFTANGILYAMILIGLNRSIDRLRSHSSSRRGVDTQLRDQMAKMLVVNGTVFFVLLAPFEVSSFVQITSPRTNEASRTVARGLMYLNSVVNPIIYTAMSQRYREAFIDAFSRSPNCRLRGTTTSGTRNQNGTYSKMTHTTTRM